MEANRRPTRRSFLGSLTALVAPVASERRAPIQDHGRINPPLPVPDVPVVRHDGQATSLAALLEQHATALQLMFTACRTTCPIQGAIFERVQSLLPDQVAGGIQLLSLSVDPVADTPAALTAWLRRFHARPGWIAAAPRRRDVERIRAFGGPGRSASDNHTTQVQLVNRQGLLVWRTFELPEAEEVATLLKKM